ncbi:MAG: Eco57I restriction-modification methylase domain-containing protein [Nitrospira sp.]|nr:Eco57I restriction-modification methylase domain-containing protein [Nitrospira sp.]
MEEAVEICKLRLFLKMVAQVDRVEQIEPLPDIDFNIRAGNTLVGYASLEDLKKSMEGDWVRLQSLPTIEESAEITDRAFQKFHEMQTKHGMQSEDFKHAKQDVRKRLMVLEGELNGYLAQQYGVDHLKTDEYEAWLDSHKPFHWFIEFYGIMKKGGFNVIIGNPPYVEYEKIARLYAIKRYETKACGNLYAFVMERAVTILRNECWLGMICPVSLGSTPRMVPLRNKLIQSSGRIYYSNFADRPSALFNGVHQILSICMMQKSVKQSVVLMSAGFTHWCKGERDLIFQKLSYLQLHTDLLRKVWPKFGNSIELTVNEKVGKDKRSLISYFLAHGKVLAISGGTGGYWLRCFDKQQESREYKECYVTDKDSQLKLCAILNSTTFYWFWRKVSDCRHLTKSDLEKFSFDVNVMAPSEELISTSRDQLHALKNTRETRLGRMTYIQYRPSKTKSLIDEIDRLLAIHYGFTDEELDFIINYDIKYRMGQDAEENGEHNQAA